MQSVTWQNPEKRCVAIVLGLDLKQRHVGFGKLQELPVGLPTPKKTTKARGGLKMTETSLQFPVSSRFQSKTVI